MLYKSALDQFQNTAVTIGNFDGLHRGHQELIHRLKKHAESMGLLSLVFSFAPHPVSVFSGKPFYTILSKEEKIKLLNELKVDIFLEYPFDKEFARIEPDDFMGMLIERLKCRALIIGEDYHFGKNRAGTPVYMKETGEKRGLKVDIVSHIYDDLGEGSERISSTRIRDCISQGMVKEAGFMLGRPYFVMGQVSSGKRLGRTIGFPTVNLIPPPFKLMPLSGVYFTKILYNGQLMPGITNVGSNPTVGGAHCTVESYIFDFNSEIYGEEIVVYFYEKIRDEIKFSSVEELKKQITNDIQSAGKFIDQ